MTTEQQLISFIGKDLKSNSITVDADTSLFKGGVLTSLELVSLLDYIEKEFGISIPSSDVDFDNFDKISSISNYIRSKR